MKYLRTYENNSIETLSELTAHVTEIILKDEFDYIDCYPIGDSELGMVLRITQENTTEDKIYKKLWDLLLPSEVSIDDINDEDDDEYRDEYSGYIYYIFDDDFQRMILKHAPEYWNLLDEYGIDEDIKKEFPEIFDSLEIGLL